MSDSAGMTEAQDADWDFAMEIVDRSKVEADAIVAQITSLARRLYAISLEQGHAAGLIKGRIDSERHRPTHEGTSE